ncbi:CACTA en-spm transposon protein [Cucumis melo var. makuwa]|uniref:CACTA en-spm transposon protein n=1 Tax=Cucumis melo var. makuwa TaxID=1194695 RepID=A0A5A7UHP1_CUCMM|nr:CACTA en-spm transposon protein [Cucumis melo var. makuwa]TYK08935.1 CACTA en-spm transposon protein [Cucumis melo var. makuwa]
MNESNTFCSCYLRGIETRFTRDERNDDTIAENEVLELHQSANLSDDFFSLTMGPSFDVRCYNGCIVAIMSYRRSNFMEMDDMFLQFEDDLDNIAGGSSSVGNNTAGSFSQQATPTPRRRVQSRLLELERHVAINGRITMTIAPGAEKPISPHVVRFSQAIGVCVRKTFLLRCFKWVDVEREYIEVVKGDLQRLFVLDFNDQAMNRFVEHQMLTTFKEFRADCHRHFKKYTDPEEVVPTHQTHWLDVMRIGTSSATIISVVHSRSNHGRTRMLDKSSLTIRVAGPSRFYNDSMSSLKEKGSRSIVWNYFGKQTFELGHSCRRPPRMCMCWVDDQATQKALVGDPSRRPTEQRVQVVHRHLVRSPQKKRLNYKLNFMKLWNGLKYKIEITKH